MVAINKTGAPITGAFNLNYLKPGTTASVYRLTSASSTPQAAGTITIGAGGSFNYDMPAYTVTTLKINLTSPAPRAWTGAGDGSHWSDAANWSGNTVPLTSDDVVISVPTSNPTILLDSGNYIVRSLESDEALAIAGNATLTIAGNATIRSTLSLQSSAQLTVSSGASALVKLNGLSITGSSKLDLNDNDLLLDYTGSSQLPAIQQLINTARSGGDWTGNGLTSSTARDNASHNTTLGAMEATDYKSIYGASATFDGEPLDSTAVVVKYTYYGDTDFNGKVNFDDYVRTDNGFNNHLTGWLNGDFDGNGSVNFDDYVLIDLAFNTQGAPLRRGARFAR
jgi:hypothetical protein